ncbi:hypothetical protein IWX46DRAFT_179811 [Phyllosticta citricarpa]|uniref:Uncharacterized protein n=1 Tax=Phyllosticta citricarpa TaxID=55181 RepID=A0ABR1M5T8_9PEZI
MIETATNRKRRTYYAVSMGSVRESRGRQRISFSTRKFAMDGGRGMNEAFRFGLVWLWLWLWAGAPLRVADAPPISLPRAACRCGRLSFPSLGFACGSVRGAAPRFPAGEMLGFRIYFVGGLARHLYDARLLFSGGSHRDMQFFSTMFLNYISLLMKLE